jgi:hypothetical protein
VPGATRHLRRRMPASARPPAWGCRQGATGRLWALLREPCRSRGSSRGGERVSAASDRLLIIRRPTDRALALAARPALCPPLRRSAGSTSVGVGDRTTTPAGSSLRLFRPCSRSLAAVGDVLLAAFVGIGIWIRRTSLLASFLAAAGLRAWRRGPAMDLKATACQRPGRAVRGGFASPIPGAQREKGNSCTGCNDLRATLGAAGLNLTLKGKPCLSTTRNFAGAGGGWQPAKRG